jgi:outer membrane protein TolC
VCRRVVINDGDLNWEKMTGLQQYDVAEALPAAAQSAFAAANDSYALGVGIFTDAVSAGAALAAAREDTMRAYAQSLINAASLAFTTGDLIALMAGGLPGSRQ